VSTTSVRPWPTRPGTGSSSGPRGSARIYDLVYEGNDLESLVARLAAVPYRIVDNPSVDREEY
jgi:hypothetical protein